MTFTDFCSTHSILLGVNILSRLAKLESDISQYFLYADRDG